MYGQLLSTFELHYTLQLLETRGSYGLDLRAFTVAGAAHPYQSRSQEATSYWALPDFDSFKRSTCHDAQGDYFSSYNKLGTADF